jgi:dienelactone hydrolase
MPVGATSVVLFAHGSGSSRHSPRNQAVARTLQEAGIGTLLFDLLTRDEELADARTAHIRFNIDLLARRLVGATLWLKKQPGGDRLTFGYFGSSTGGAAALVAAAQLGPAVAAVVSRGGRPDLAGDSLPRVLAPTLLLVGEYDDEVLRLNQQAAERLRSENELVVVPQATHLFEEPGALELVADLASSWFQRHLKIH